MAEKQAKGPEKRPSLKELGLPNEPPPGWTVVEHVSSGGVKYKRYVGPDGKKAQSLLDAWCQVNGVETGAGAGSSRSTSLRL